MQATLPITFDLTDKQQIKKTWAFAANRAINTRSFIKNRRRLSDFRSCVITSCSKEAKALGVRAGMRYSEAKALVPSMRILVIGGRNV